MLDKPGQPGIADYSYYGFNAFLTRSIASTPAQASATNLAQTQMAATPSTAINFSAGAVSGSLGDVLKVGNIYIDGTSSRISVYDDGGNEIVRIGQL